MLACRAIRLPLKFPPLFFAAIRSSICLRSTMGKELLLALYDHLNARLPSHSLTPQVSTALFRRDQEFYLLAVNNGNEDKIAEIVLDENLLERPAAWQARNLISGRERSFNLHEHSHLTFPVPRKDGVILQL